jgi:hypothetical protein
MHRAKREFSHALRLIERVCRLAGDRGLIRDAQRLFRQEGLAAAVQRHDNMMLFDWLAETFSYQGISNRAAMTYMQQHGRLRAHDIVAGFSRKPSCPKLRSYWHFERCGYSKAERICSEPRHFSNCPLPTHDLRNGRLNQTSYSLFLFLRDVTGDDLVAWFDAQLATVSSFPKHSHSHRLRIALLDPLGQIFGVSDKVASMTLANLLLAADPGRTSWIKAGAEEGLDQCNGRQIDDSERCDRKKCPLFQRCDRVAPTRNEAERMPKPKSRVAIVAFGLDADGRPRAGRFRPEDEPLAHRAAEALGLQLAIVGDRVLLKKLPQGNTFAPASGFVRTISQPTLDALMATQTAEFD